MDRSGVAVVLLPAVDEKVTKVSSEQVPHMTLLYLPPADQIPNLEEIVLYIQHAAKELSPVWMTVDYRGELGEDNADVLFFRKERHTSYDRIEDFRHHLLLNDSLKMAYDSIEQFPEFTPHLTLGYPESPAHETDEKIWSVEFDRLAVWTSEYDGPEFRLEYADTMAESSMYMSDISKAGQIAAQQMFAGLIEAKEIKHYGVKGMKWGVRKDRAASRGGASQGPTAVVVNQKKPGKFAKAEGGQGFPAHDDAINTLVTRQVARKSTTDALSNAELKTAIERMQLEQRYNQLEFASDRRSRGARFVQGFLGRRKPTKYRDMDEEIGEDTRKAVKKAIAYQMAKKAAAAAAVAA